MLRAEGIESMVRRAGTFGVPQFGDAAPHEVLVNESDYDRAHELVHRGEIQVHLPGSRSGPEPGNLLAAILIVLGLIALAAWLSGQF